MEIYSLVFLFFLNTIPTPSHLYPVTDTGHTDEIIKKLVANMTQLRQDVDASKVREQELNKTIKLQQQVIHDQDTKIKEQQRLSQQSQDRINMLENKVNQTFGAHEVILHDVIDTLNTQGHLNEDSMRNVSGQISYIALSLLDVRKQLDIFNTSEQDVARRTNNHFKDLNNQIIRLNQSLEDVRKEFKILNLSEQEVARRTDNYLKDINNQMTGLNHSLKDALRNIAFTVARSSKGPLQNQKVIYDKVISNEGNAYSTETGMFTCPRGGVYVFTWSTMSLDSNRNCYASIYRNGDRLLETHSAETNGGHHEVASNTAVLSLTVGDKVWIKTDTCGYFYGYPYTAFSGWKL